MEIINGKEGWYICIDMADAGFAESEWYPSQKQLAIAILNNDIKWHSRYPAEQGGEEGAEIVGGLRT